MIRSWWQEHLVDPREVRANVSRKALVAYLITWPMQIYRENDMIMMKGCLERDFSSWQELNDFWSHSRTPLRRN